MTAEHYIDDTTPLPDQVVEAAANLLAVGLGESIDIEGAVEATNDVLDDHGVGYEFVKKPEDNDFAQLFDRLTDERVFTPGTPIEARRKLFERMVRIDTNISSALKNERALNEKSTDYFVMILRGMARGRRSTR